MNSQPEPRSALPRASQALWLGLIGPPTIWLTAFLIKYALAGAPVDSIRHRIVVVTGLIALGAIAALGLMSYREWRWTEASPLDRFAGVTGRIRFMALLGIMTSGLFLLVMATQVIAPFFIAPGKQ